MTEKRKNVGASSQEGLGISGFTLGVLSILFASLFGLIMGIIGLCFCLIQQKKYPLKLAKAGIILNVVGIILSIITIYIDFQQIVLPAMGS
jgi:hypothetical protein